MTDHGFHSRARGFKCRVGLIMHVQIGAVPPARPLQHVQLQGGFDFEPTIFFKIMDQSAGRKARRAPNL